MKRSIIITALASFGLAFGTHIRASYAADIQVLSSTVMLGAMEKLAPEFERETGNKLIIKIEISPTAMKQITTNQVYPDVAIITGPGIDDLITRSQVLANSKSEFAHTSVAVAVRTGTSKPDISSVEAVKRALLNAKSISYTDPATGAATGVHLAKILSQLGIAEQMKSKTILGQGGPIGEIVAKGDAEIGFQQLPELLPVHGIDIVGLLPTELQNIVVIKAGVLSASKQPSAAEALVKFLSTSRAKELLKAAGIEPQ